MSWEDAIVGYFALWGAASHLFLAGLLLLAAWLWMMDRLWPSDEPDADAVDEHEALVDEGRP